MIQPQNSKSSGARYRASKSAEQSTALIARAPVPAREGYDLAATSFDRWQWCTFWHYNEAPLVRSWISGLPVGVGVDAGSGTGNYREMILHAGHQVVAVDLSASMLKILRNKSANDLTPYAIQADIQEMPFRNQVFDWVLCTRVLNHIRSIQPVLDDFARVLRSNARALITDIHPQHPYNYTTVETDDGSVPIRTYKHTLTQLIDLLRQQGAFEISELREFGSDELPWQPHYQPFTKLFEHGATSVFYMMQLRRL